jgi:hypothetical protein
MKNITKLLLVLVSSVSLSFAAVAGEVSMSGSAKASYKIGGADDSIGKGIGVSNELTAKASGELDNGYTWNYHIDLDPGASGSMTQDDAAQTLSMGPIGTIGFFDGEGSLHSNLKWGVGAMGTGSDYAGTMTIAYGGDIDTETNVQYHTPAGLLPFDVQVKFGYAPNLADTTGGNDYKSEGAAQTAALGGTSAQQYFLSAVPVDGLNIYADYYETDDSLATAQDYQSGGYAAQYAMGNFKFGYGKNYYAPALTAKNGVKTMYETDSYGVEFAVNDALSISYSEENSEATTNVAIAGAATSGTKTRVESEITSIQAAYVIGGATLGVAITESDNADYVANKEEKVTVFSLAMAF